MLKTEQKRGKLRKVKWAIFWAANVVGLVLMLPVLVKVWPLIEIYWATRNETAVQELSRSETDHARLEGGLSVTHPAVQLNRLKKLKAVAGLDRRTINQIVAQQFGPPPQTSTNPAEFDQDSAIFRDINKTIQGVGQKSYHVYVIDLEDQNGNLARRVIISEQPDVELERSMRAMKLIQKSPQLKGIYEAFAPFLASRSNPKTQSAGAGAQDASK